MADIIGKVFSGMFVALFVVYLLIYGFTAAFPAATSITVWGMDFEWIGLLIVLAVVLGSGYLVVKHYTSGFK
jgi:hypothetical protein